MANNRSMQQKNLVNRRRQMKDMLETNRLIMSTYVYWRDESKMSDYMKKSAKYANNRDKKYIVYFNKNLHCKGVIERQKYQFIQQLYDVDIIKYTNDTQYTQ